MYYYYESRSPRLIGSTHQWIKGMIKNDERKSINNEAFDYFLEELQRGENILNAKRNAQKKFDVQIEFDTVIPENLFAKSTLVIKVG